MPTNRACGLAAFYEYSGNYVERHYELLMPSLPRLIGGYTLWRDATTFRVTPRIPLRQSAFDPLRARVAPERSGGGEVQESFAITLAIIIEICQLLMTLISSEITR